MSRFAVILLLCVMSGALLLIPTGCGEAEEEPEREPILLDQYNFYILDPGPFEVIEPEYPGQSEFLIFSLDGIEISCGSLLNTFMTEESAETDVALFARETMRTQSWLPGVNRWMLDAEEVTIDGRWFFVVTLLARRDPELTSRLTQIQRITHRREIERFENNVDYIVRLYHTISDSDLHIFTLSGKPEDVVIYETDVRRLLSNFRGSASEATAALEYGESAGDGE